MATRSSPSKSPTAESLANLSEWIDQANAHRDPESVLWGRVCKITEETGEAVTALIAYTGQNPRKPKRPEARGELIAELLDVAVTALTAVEHLSGNNGMSIEMLELKVATVVARAGL